MMTTRTTAILTVAVIACISWTIAVAQAAPADLANWFRTQPPKEGPLRSKSGRPYELTEPGVEVYAANYSEYEWEVFKDAGHVYVRRIQSQDREASADLPFEIPREPAFAGRRSTLPVDNGWLLGFDAGEWGGSLWWFSKDGKEKYRISVDQVVQFLTMDSEVYALEGLAHMTISRGKVLQLSRGKERNGRWTARTFVVLPEAPAVAVRWGADLIVVIYSGLVRVRKNGTMEVLLSQTFWGSLYPNSIAIDHQGSLYIGMRQGVAKWRIGDKPGSMQWLVPSEKFLQEELERLNRQTD
jgi:hypothetical protein